MNFEVYAIAPEINPSELIKLESLGVKYREVLFQRKGINPLELIRSIYLVYREIKKINPDLVFSYTHKSVLIGSLASYFSGIDEVYSMITGRGHIFDQENRQIQRLHCKTLEDHFCLNFFYSAML